ncbi:hypothetical protein CHS0354_012016 [Potamilus streckersoni]|uniref:Nucleolar protein 6 n=1 Tax=Potamilus streckersoni TaxID=2493646 RepID=A0AAE0SC59_9BIVA|nr:hypothetical protein CHS0354_012016 [Potamilus streckersoni]
MGTDMEDDKRSPIGSDEPPLKQARLSKGKLYMPPTNEELNQLRETENLFHSSLFRLQISELLSEVRLKEKRKRIMNIAAKELRQILLKLPEGKEHDIMHQKWLTKSGFQVPLNQNPWDVKGKFHFLPPKEATIIGSFTSDTCVKPDVHLDMMVVIPKECIQAKDHLNHRYARKRALYLTVLAKHLDNQPKVEDLMFTYHHGNHLKPVLVVTFKVEDCKLVNIHLHPVPEEGSFKVNRFHICKNNIRPHWYRGQAAVGDQVEENQPSTPFYNSTVLEDLTMKTNQEFLMQQQEDSSGVKEGITLLKVWLRQRELDYGYGGFTGFIMSMYVTYLLSQRKLNVLMSSYQVMRNTLINLTKSDWTTEGISLQAPEGQPHIPTMSDFHDNFDVVFVDRSGFLNICYSVNSNTFQRVRHEAELAIEMLERIDLDNFESLFMKPVPFHLKFDHMFHINCTDDLITSFDGLGLSEQLIDSCGDYVQTCLPTILKILGKALGKRVRLLQNKLISPPKWYVTSSPPKVPFTDRLTVGLLLDPEYSSNVLDKGPSADLAEAAEFREFWGEKCELRRFQDGSICEAVLWAAGGTMSTKRLICSKIVTYVLKKCLGLSKKNLDYIGGQLDDLLHMPIHIKGNLPPYGTGEEQTLAIMNVYDDLCKILRRLELPLTINSIQGTSPVFRHTEVFSPLPAKYKHVEYASDDVRLLPRADKPCPVWSPIQKVVCLLEGSGHWPDDLEALRRVKAAFHIKVAELLNQNKLPVQVQPTSVLVLKDGYVFQVELAHTREIGLLKLTKTQDGMVKMRDTEQSLALEKEIIALPKLTSTLHGLQQQCNSFSGTVRLANRWVAAQMLSDFVPDIAVDLMVAHIYIAPLPFKVPGSPLVGFQRFLTLLSTFDWSTSPLIINLNYKFTKEDLTEIRSRFTKERSTLPLMFLSTPEDKFSSLWTKRAPTAPILQRLILLASESLKVLNKQLENSDGQDFRQIFRPPLDVYNVLIHLCQKQLPRQHQAVDLRKDTYIPCYQDDVESNKFPITQFDPVQIYLKELRASYDEFALFFHDTFGGNVIGVIWKPNVFVPQQFKVSHVNAHKPQASAGQEMELVSNIEAIVEDFRILGGGLVASIEVKS